MVKLIVGNKGTGKTKQLLEDIKFAEQNEQGNVIFINTSGERMSVDLSVRIINAKEYKIENYKEFLCFISGATSQNYDISHIFIDGLLKITGNDLEGLELFVNGLEEISKENNIKFTITVSADKSNISEKLYGYIA